jgi:hypothetical protein
LTSELERSGATGAIEEDEARGVEIGDLPGWMWAEVPRGEQ